MVTTYNQNQVYRRSAVSASDDSDWYVVADDVLRLLSRVLRAAGCGAVDRARARAELVADTFNNAIRVVCFGNAKGCHKWRAICP